MSMTAKANLYYGCVLLTDEEWQVEEADEYGDLNPKTHSWLDTYNRDEDEETDLLEIMHERLLAGVGFIEKDWKVAGFDKRKLDAEKKLGVVIESTGHDEVPGYVLVIDQDVKDRITVDWSEVMEVYPAELIQNVENDWDAKIAAALRCLELTPKQKDPSWLLCVHYY